MTVLNCSFWNQDISGLRFSGQVGSSCPGEANSVYTLTMISTIAILIIKIRVFFTWLKSERTRKELGSWLTWVYSQFIEQSLLKNIGENVWPCLGPSLLPMASFTRGSGRFFHASCMCMHSVAQLCLTLFNAIDCNPPGSSVIGISQAGILEWVAISFFRGSSWPKDRTCSNFIGRWILYH